MDQHVTIDVDFLEQLPAKTMLKLVERKQAVQKHMALYLHTVQTLAPLFRFLEDADIDIDFDPNRGDIDLHFTGDGARLGKVWGELRRNGYKTESRPKQGDTAFQAFWDCEGFSRIWLSFSSSVCKRVQVGTKTVEVPVYETQCGDLPVLEQLEPAAGSVMAISDIPF